MQNLTPEEITTVLKREKDGVLAFTDGKRPYAIPVGFVYVDDHVYFSIFAKGRKWEMFQQNPNVCFTAYSWDDSRTTWDSVVLEGRMVHVGGIEEIEGVVRANIPPSHPNPDEHFNKRIQYYKTNRDNASAVKLFKIEPSQMGGKKSRSH